MSERRNMPIPEAVEINPKVTLKRGETYKFVEMADLVEKVTRVRSKESKEFKGSGTKFRVGDTLFARITPCLENGKIAKYTGLAGELGFGSTEFIVFRGRDGITTTDYAHYLATNPRFIDFAISKMTGSSGRQRVPAEALGHYSVSVPSIDDQKSITKVLKDFDDKVELLRETNRTLEEIARAVFRAWFVDFEPVRAKAAGATSFHGMRQDLFNTLPDSFEPSEIGEVPTGWKIETIGTLTDCVGGGTPSTKNTMYWENGTHPFCAPKDMSGLSSIVLRGTERHLTDAGVEKISSGALPVGSVLLSSRAPIGYIAINYVPVSINQGIIALKPKVLPTEYLRFWLEFNMSTIKSNAGGTTFAEISKSKFRPIPAVRPSDDILADYAMTTRPSFDRVASNDTEISTLEALRDTLLPKLISGEVEAPSLDALGLGGDV